eukprot:gnl/TRDRNA2_/TRDRNA2_140157_c1_seq1.p1 gnl/TRDRNA2_/TRDRNA2_140157_c1~~gnl/TRDRNA2_/TRDRNA2_140157_c1_seq1.p1  ORF type:complete len:115 (+),score=17.87 gnl/TRDRNA2_/TRDRNA2_140157_c1_seq1:2-346(+)
MAVRAALAKEEMDDMIARNERVSAELAASLQKVISFGDVQRERHGAQQGQEECVSKTGEQQVQLPTYEATNAMQTVSNAYAQLLASVRESEMQVQNILRKQFERLEQMSAYSKI